MGVEAALHAPDPKLQGLGGEDSIVCLTDSAGSPPKPQWTFVSIDGRFLKQFHWHSRACEQRSLRARDFVLDGWHGVEGRPTASQFLGIGGLKGIREIGLLGPCLVLTNASWYV